MRGLVSGALVLGCVAGLASCGGAPRHGRVLALGLAVFSKSPDGRQVPGAATAGFLAAAGKGWRHGTLADPESNVFHAVLEYCPPAGGCGLLTVAGSAAMLKLWRANGETQVVWEADFGGRFSRMRDVEIADVLGNGVPALVVGTHDQGVVALIQPDGQGGYKAVEIDRQPETFVHEIETGDLDGDGVLEVYATVSRPNVFDGTPQPGAVLRYIPARDEGRTVFADLGDRHAKEILVTDLDGDGKSELYASVEAVSGGSLEVRRFLAGAAPVSGETLAVLPDRMCRCLTAGDVDGDGRREIVAATAKAGLWLLRPEPSGSPWLTEQIAGDSSGFEHAALLTDLDGDGRDELYVASDAQHEMRRYTWAPESWSKEVLYRYPSDLRYFTWNVRAVDAAVVPPSAWE